MKVTKFYKGTPNQAMSLAEDHMRRMHEAKVESTTFCNVNEALRHFMEEVEDLEYTLRDADKQDLLNAIFKFSSVQHSLDMLLIKVNQAYDRDEEEENNDEVN